MVRACPRITAWHRGRLNAAVARRQVPGIAALFRGSGNAARVALGRPNAAVILGQALAPDRLSRRGDDLLSAQLLPGGLGADQDTRLGHVAPAQRQGELFNQWL